MKEIIINLYKLFKRKNHRYEHLGNIVSNVQNPDNKQSALAAVYTTGLIGQNMFEFSSDTFQRPNLNFKPSDSNSEHTTKADVEVEAPHSLPDDLEVNTTQNVALEDDLVIAEEIFETEVIESKTTHEKQPTPPLVEEESATKILWEEDVNQLSADLTTPIETEKPEQKKKKKKKGKEKKPSGKKAKEKNKSANSSVKLEKKNSNPIAEKDTFDQFESWLFHLSPLEGSKLNSKITKSKKKKKKKKVKKLSKAEMSAKQSVTKPQDVASATLASLLAKQGHHKEAIAMYKKLIKIDPDKVALYQMKIDSLEQS